MSYFNLTIFKQIHSKQYQVRTINIHKMILL